MSGFNFVRLLNCIRLFWLDACFVVWLCGFRFLFVLMLFDNSLAIGRFAACCTICCDEFHRCLCFECLIIWLCNLRFFGFCFGCTVCCFALRSVVTLFCVVLWVR